MNILTIRAEQMEVLRRTMRERFQQRMVRHLRQRFAEQTKELDDQALARLVEERMQEAGEFGIRGERDLQRYLEYAVEVGSDFPEAPGLKPVRRILADTTLTGTAKMNRIDQHMTFARRPS